MQTSHDFIFVTNKPKAQILDLIYFDQDVLDKVLYRLLNSTLSVTSGSLISIIIVMGSPVIIYIS